ncbi:ABC transporter substrate-binding protein [Methylobacterium oryzisoli]|uniref:ABC transporter substrate-binding protein n=1 Tax=Methylobacterium oryzisoli TaxID=3385502 RepID=UPI003892CB6C
MISFRRLALAGTLAACALVGAGEARAQGKTITVCWAAWDPANALVELSKDFTAKTGITMRFEFVPWPNFADRMLNELNSKGRLCDLMIGDSQWIGGAAENGHYVKLNDFFDKEGIRMADFLPATVEGYATWPKGSQDYWALPAMGDAVGWTYRKDWFSRPEIQAEFKAKHGRDLAAPKTWTELKQVAEFFQNREIDGRRVYGASIYTERGSEGITMGATNALYAFGFQYQDPKKPYAMEGFVNSPEAVAGLEFYKSLFRCCTPPGASNSYMQEGLDAFKSGQVAMQMNFFAFFPGLQKDPNVGGDRIGFFVNPSEKTAGSQLGGQGISVVSYSRNHAESLAYIKWFADPAVQKRWWQLGGYSCHKAVLGDPNFAQTAPFAADFLRAMGQVRDFWQEPSYAQLLQASQRRFHDFVVADRGTAKQTLDLLIQDWTKVFKEDGKL